MGLKTVLGVVFVAAAGILAPAPPEGLFHLMQIEQVIAGVNGDTSAQAVVIPGRGIPKGTKVVGLETVVTGLVSPVLVTHAGDRRLFVADQIGRIHVIENGSLRATPFLDLTSKIVPLTPTYDERGLLGLAFHPNFVVNGKFYVYYSGPSTLPGFNHRSVLSEFLVSVDPNVADASSERVVLTIDEPQSNHNGGALAFGPDGFLYIATGDGGAAGDTGDGHTPITGNAQDKTNLLGKILRIDLDRRDPGLEYAIPTSNPFVGVPGARGEIYAYGLRNPYRISFDRGGARRLFAADVGQNSVEEVDIITSGGNYGWKAKEGTHPFDTNLPQTGYLDPIAEYTHAEGTAIVGGFVYRGPTMPALQGRYVFGDFSKDLNDFPLGKGRLFYLEESPANTFTLFELHIGPVEGPLGPVFVKGFGEDADGELYVLVAQQPGPSGSSGAVLKLVPVKSAPTLAVATDRTAFTSGGSLRVSASVDNPGLASTVDFYFGALLPDGDTVLLFTDLGFTTAVGRLSSPATLQPIVAGVDLSTPFVFDQPAFFTYQWQGAEPAGSYTLFLAAVKSGALFDNSIDPGDIVALSIATVTFTP